MKTPPAEHGAAGVQGIKPHSAAPARREVTLLWNAYVVKVTILAALLHKAEDQHRHLTATEAARARSMITRSGNDAASALWAELGRRYLWLRLSRPSAGVSRPARRPWPTGSPPSRRSPRRSTTTSTPPRHRPSRHPGHSRRRKLQTSTSPHPDSVRYERVEIHFPILRGRRLDDLRFEDPGSPFFGVALVLPRRMQIIEDLRARGYPGLQAGEETPLHPPEMSVVPDSVFVCPGTGCSPPPPSRRCCGTTAATPGTSGTWPSSSTPTGTRADRTPRVTWSSAGNSPRPERRTRGWPPAPRRCSSRRCATSPGR